MRAFAVACLVTLALLPGCETRNKYLVNRGGDLADVFRIHGMFGPGIAAKVEVTRMLQFGFAFEFNAMAAGLHDRALGTWRETIVSWGLLVGHHHEQVYGIPHVSGDYGWRFDEGGRFETTAGSTLDLITLRATGMFILGIDFEFRLGELFDFVAGIFQFDPAGDDIDPSKLRAPPAPEPRAKPSTTSGGSGGLDKL